MGLAGLLAGAVGAEPLLPGPKLPGGSLDAADVDGDMKPDLVVSTADGVVLRRGNGDGTYQTPELLDGEQTGRVILADLDGDGAIDLLLVRGGLDESTATVRLGNGDGTFAPGTAFPLLGRPRDVALADVNGDTYRDLVTANVAPSGVNVLLGNGDGSFAPAQSFELFDGRGSNSPRTVSVADLDGDLAPDLVVATWSVGLSVLMGNGDGTFQPALGIEEGAREPDTDYAAVADVDGDAVPDLLTVGPFENALGLWRGNGDGTFQDPTHLTAGDHPRAVLVTDVDGQAGLDVVLASFNGGVSVLLGNGDGSFQPELELLAEWQPFGLIAADVDGNGTTDFVTANQASEDLSVLLRNEDGSYFLPGQHAIGTAPRGITSADLDGDGIPDLAAANSESHDLSVLFGRGDGDFEPAQALVAGTTPKAVVAADLDGDGVPDLVTANEDSNDVTVSIGLGDGSFLPPASFPAGEGPGTLAVADLDGDGALDVVAAPKNREYGSDRVHALLGNGDGSLQAPISTPDSFRISSLALADLDGDGETDLALTNVQGLSVWPGQGDGSFGAPHDLPIEGAPLAVAASDVNDDGVPDLMVGTREFLGGNEVRSDISVFLGKGDGLFHAPVRYPTGDYPVSISGADLDLDGALDLAVATSITASVNVLFGNGDGSFREPEAYATGINPEQLAVADLDGDGLMDVASANYRTDDVSVLINQRELPPCPIDPITGVVLCSESCQAVECETPACGLLGIEPVVLLAWLGWRRRRRPTGLDR